MIGTGAVRSGIKALGEGNGRLSQEGLPNDPKLYPTEADINRAYHRFPTGEAWKAVTLARIEERGIDIIPAAAAVSAAPRLAAGQRRSAWHPHGHPLKPLERRIRCTMCRARLIHVTHEPYSVRHDQLGEPRV